MKHGLFPGRFLTFHEGHLFAAQMTAALVDRLTICVVGTSSDAHTMEERADWIRRSVKADVCRVAYDPPWRTTNGIEFISNACPNADMLAGGFSGIADLAKDIQAEPLVIDRPREVFDLSSAKIVSDPARHWNQIVPAARVPFQKRICLVGPESVGKSVACATLAKKYDTRVIPEFGRNYEEDVKRGADWGSADFVKLSEQHIAWADQIAARAGPVVFEDTEIIQTMIWAEHMTGSIPEELHLLEQKRIKPDLYLVLAPDVDWIDDGTRYAGDPAVRQFFFERLVHHINRLGYPSVIVSGAEFSERDNQINNAVLSVCG